MIKAFVPSISNRYRGASVALSGDRLLVGGAVTSNQVAELFERNRGGADNWWLARTFTPTAPSSFGLFGTSVAA